MRSLIAITALAVGASLAASRAAALTLGECRDMAGMNAALKAEGQHTLLIGNRLAYEDQSITFMGMTRTRTGWQDLTGDIRSNGPQRQKIADGLRAAGRTDAHIDAFFVKLLGVSQILEKGDPESPIPHLMTAFISNDSGTAAYVLEGNRPATETSTRACVRATLSDVRLALGSSEPLHARGNMVQLNGRQISGLQLILKGGANDRSATFAAVGSDTHKALFYMDGVRPTTYALSRR